MRWLQEYEENSLTFVENAVKADKQEGVSNPNTLDIYACICNKFSLPSMETSLSPSRFLMCSATCTKATSWSRGYTVLTCSFALVTYTVMQKLCML